MLVDARDDAAPREGAPPGLSGGHTDPPEESVQTFGEDKKAGAAHNK